MLSISFVNLKIETINFSYMWGYDYWFSELTRDWYVPSSNTYVTQSSRVERQRILDCRHCVCVYSLIM